MKAYACVLTAGVDGSTNIEGSPPPRLRETIPQPHSLLGTMLVRDIDDDDVQAQGPARRINRHCIRLARNKWINPELCRIKKASLKIIVDAKEIEGKIRKG